jgi:hypothetical protein
MRSVERLGNGVVLVLDRFESPTAAVVVAAGVGSLYEERRQRGITHLLEHMLFRVPGFDVDEAVEALGGSNNAYTQRDLLAVVLEGVSDAPFFSWPDEGGSRVWRACGSPGRGAGQLGRHAPFPSTRIMISG